MVMSSVSVSAYSGVATLTYPANGATGISTNPTLTWTRPSGANYYEICVNPGSSPVYYHSSTTSVTVSLNANTWYWWQVRCSNDGGATYGPWCSSWSFKTWWSNSVATLTYPANGATGISTSPTLTWTGPTGANYYKIIVNPGSSPVAYYSSTTSVTVSPPLSTNTWYWWQVLSSNDGGVTYGPGCPSWSFKTISSRFAFLVYCDPGGLPLDWYRNLVNSIYDDLIADGYSPANVHYLGFDGPQSNPRLDAATTEANIDQHLDDLAATLNANDFFFLFWVGHGTQNQGFNIRLSQGEMATYQEVQAWMNAITASKMVLCFHPCFSGGVLPFVDAANRVCISSAAADETNGGWGEYFRDGLLGAADNPDPDGNPATVDSHGDGNGVISMDEAYYYGAYRALALTGQHSHVEDCPSNGDGGSFYTEASYDPANPAKDGYLADHTNL